LCHSTIYVFDFGILLTVNEHRKLEMFIMTCYKGFGYWFKDRYLKVNRLS